MRRALVLPLIPLALTLSAGWAIAAAPDAKGPPCTDITEAGFHYSGVNTDPASGVTATVDIRLDVASCTRITYTLVVLDDLATKAPVVDASVSGDGDADIPLTGEDIVTVTATVPESERDGNICVYATTSDGRRDIDRVPDADFAHCFELIPGGSAGGAGFG
jgi:hypothetical protein